MLGLFLQVQPSVQQKEGEGEGLRFLFVRHSANLYPPSHFPIQFFDRNFFPPPPPPPLIRTNCLCYDREEEKKARLPPPTQREGPPFPGLIMEENFPRGSDKSIRDFRIDAKFGYVSGSSSQVSVLTLRHSIFQKTKEAGVMIRIETLPLLHFRK